MADKMQAEISVSPSPAAISAEDVLRCALDIAQATLKSGGSIARVEDTVTRICRAYGAVHVEVFAILSMIHAAVRMPDGSYSVQLRRIYRTENDYKRLEEINALSRRVCRDTPGAEWIQGELELIKKRASMPFWGLLLGAALTGFGFSVFYGGGWLDGLAAGIICVVMMLFSHLFLRFSSDMAGTLLSAMIGGLLAMATVPLGLGLHTDSIVIGTVMILIPGLALGTSLEEMLCDDTLSGILRLFRSVTKAVMIALGYAVGILIFGGNLEMHAGFGDPIPVLITGVVGALGYSLLLGAKWIRLPAIGLSCLFTVGAYLLASHFIDGEFLPNLIAASLAAVAAEILARVCHSPAAIFCIPVLIPLVPGSSLFYAINHLFFGAPETALQYGAKALEVGLGIAAGRIGVSLAMLAIRHVRQRSGKEK